MGDPITPWDGRWRSEAGRTDQSCIIWGIISIGTLGCILPQVRTSQYSSPQTLVDLWRRQPGHSSDIFWENERFRYL